MSTLKISFGNGAEPPLMPGQNNATTTESTPTEPPDWWGRPMV